jgi:hypothetical protein
MLLERNDSDVHGKQQLEVASSPPDLADVYLQLERQGVKCHGHAVNAVLALQLGGATLADRVQAVAAGDGARGCPVERGVAATHLGESVGH